MRHRQIVAEEARPLPRRRRNMMFATHHFGAGAIWMGGAFSTAATVAVAALLASGFHYRGVVAAVTLSARVAFVFFLAAYTGGALAAAFGSNFAALARRRREFGLAFAAALAVHLTCVAVLFRISLARPIGNAGIVYFGLGAWWTYALAACSIERVRRVLPPRVWRIMRGIGMEYIAWLFILDFVVGPIRNGFNHPLDYAPFAALAILAPLLRWTVLLQRWRVKRRLSRSPPITETARQRPGFRRRSVPFRRPNDPSVNR
jgi:hypothetical protein